MTPLPIPLAASKSRKLSIDLLPEFGWSVRGEAAYGPGSVFQGSVKILSPDRIQADHVRLVFQAYEAMHPIELSPGVLRTKKKRVLFAVQQKVWKGETLDTSETMPFIIQIPTVQYPPSIEKHPYYECVFRLTAIVMSKDQAILSTEKHIQYRPFVETSLLKRSIHITPYLRIQSLDYVPGDTISLIPTASTSYDTSTSSFDSAVDTSSSSSATTSITVKLVQKSYLQAVEDVPETVAVIATEKWKCTSEPIRLTIPYDQVPSLSYSSILSVTYVLQITIKQKKKRWASSSQTHEYPIRIGTLGYGVRAPTELQVYSAMTDEQIQGEQPRFLQAIEYESSPPVYDHIRLPGYDS